MAGEQRCRPDAEQRHQRDHDDGVQGHEARILHVAAGQHRAALSGPDLFADPRRGHERHQQGSGKLCPASREHRRELALPEQHGDRDPDDEDRYPGQDERGGAQAPPPREPGPGLPRGGQVLVRSSR
jgi:hypothetical protein